MTKATNDFRAAVLSLSETQSRQSWIREQEYKKARGEFFYTSLVDTATNEVVATVAAR
jgi:hypothetical protein